MNLSDEDINKLADALFERLMKQQEKFEAEHNTFILSDEFGNSKTVSEAEYLQFELTKLEDLMNTYVQEEHYEKAEMLKSKIRIIRNKIQKL